jgi:hypothetical protein
MAELLQVIVEALRHTAAAVPEGVPAPDPSGILMHNAMRILSGDWTPFDAIHQPVQAYIVAQLNGSATPEAIGALAQRMSEEARTYLLTDGNINQIVGLSCRDDADPIGQTVDAIHRNLVSTLTLWTTHSTGVFSTALKDLQIDFVGRWFEALSSSLLQGRAGLRPLLSQLSMAAGMAITQRYPQQAQMAMFGLPMLTGMMMQFDEEYRRRAQHSGGAHSSQAAAQHH